VNEKDPKAYSAAGDANEKRNTRRERREGGGEEGTSRRRWDLRIRISEGDAPRNMLVVADQDPRAPRRRDACTCVHAKPPLVSAPDIVLPYPAPHSLASPLPLEARFTALLCKTERETTPLHAHALLPHRERAQYVPPTPGTIMTPYCCTPGLPPVSKVPNDDGSVPTGGGAHLVAVVVDDNNVVLVHEVLVEGSRAKRSGHTEPAENASVGENAHAARQDCPMTGGEHRQAR